MISVETEMTLVEAKIVSVEAKMILELSQSSFITSKLDSGKAKLSIALTKLS